MDKISYVRNALLPEKVSDEELTALLDTAGGIVLNRRYPFGYPEDTEVPKRFEMIQCQMAVELYNRKGAEGEMSHSEGGVTRSYEGGTVSQSLLKQIVPMCGSVNSNA